MKQMTKTSKNGTASPVGLPKLQANPNAEARRFISRLRREFAATLRRREKIASLTERTRAEMAKRPAPAVPPSYHRDRRPSVDADIRLLQADVRRLLDDTSQAASRVVSSRIAVATGDGKNQGKLDLVTDKRSFTPTPARGHSTEALSLARVLYEIIDTSLHELEQLVRAQHAEITELRKSVQSMR